jgi:hypothetical protein
VELLNERLAQNLKSRLNVICWYPNLDGFGNIFQESSDLAVASHGWRL